MPDDSRSLRRACRALLAAAAAAALAVPSARLHAQAACVSGTLASYLAEGSACRLDGWVLSAFQYQPLLSMPAEVPGLVGAVPGPADIVLRPLAGAASGGARELGLALDGFRSTLAADAVTSADPLSLALTLLRFTARLPGAGAGVVQVAADVGVTLTNPGPDALTLLPSAAASAFDADRLGACLIDELPTFPPATVTGTLTGRCEPAAAGVEVILGHTLILNRRPGVDGPLTGSAAAFVTRVTLTTAPQVVPEPSTFALSLGGLVVVAILCRPRCATEKENSHSHTPWF